MILMMSLLTRGQHKHTLINTKISVSKKHYVSHGLDYFVSSSQGIGAKLKIAQSLNKHDTIGIDLVAMNVNDVLAYGAKPVLFTHHLAIGNIDNDVVQKIIQGIHKGCTQSDCEMLSQAPIEMFGSYGTGLYDLVGFALGIVSKSLVIDGKTIQAGDVLIGIPSSGLHTSGYCTVRKVLNGKRINLHSQCSWRQDGDTFGHELLIPSRNYVKDVLYVLDDLQIDVKGICHITNGGMTKKKSQMFVKNSGLGSQIEKTSWQVPEVFHFIKKNGFITDAELWREFNMGIGMVLALNESNVSQVCQAIPDAKVIGVVVEGEGVTYV